ncbi:hypothetical protein G3N56_02335 [Desulfovibrio sulfodismutans]|uniref:Uncharacterized protein n=1 Tax=Desulfolutivibrio sulfodismutans TaxID=63561 RepID=A0A7K3NID8_9BACT|nr:hypothetical protein [Desulfolutivibrio sulfodismutans]NDY55583.1 hypothetical protein [Desulfolutivibrio sulfodismutans]QLA11484.1 hypothetical protein GD606_03930 [Desulfolutivibrio sulfodismutans DSM 3696]
MKNTPEADRVRLVIQGLSVGGKQPVPYPLIYEALACADEPAKARVRRLINEMVKRRELIRVEDGVIRFNPDTDEKRQGEFYHRIWRAIRSAKPGFSYHDLASVACVSYDHVRKYSQWLADAGYLERHGMRSQAYLFRATEAAKNRVDTPWPPRKIRDPFEAEKRSSLEIVRLFLTHDLYQPAIKKKIVANCRVILARFEKEDDADESEAVD